VEAPRFPLGVVRSPLQPEEVRGLTRSGELSRMLPSEMALLAHGWPRKVSSQPSAAAAVQEAAIAEDRDAQLIEEEYYLPGAHAARLLHRVRRAERMLLSYERCGWLDGTPSRLTGRQVRSPAELSTSALSRISAHIVAATGRCSHHSP
jgi:hypothetical protein